MTATQATRLAELQACMTEEGLDLFVVQDPDSMVAFAGFWNYLGMEFGRATLLAVPRDGAPVLIAPAMEAEMARAMSWIAEVRPWADGRDGEWMAPLEAVVAAAPGPAIAVEHDKTHPRVLALLGRAAGTDLRDGTALIAALRTIKSPEEIAILRQAGQVAVAMGEAGRAAIGVGVPEYEVALAVSAAGTRKAAEFTTRIAPGMCFAVEGGITVEGEIGTRVGDSVVVTEDGFEYLTGFPRELAVL